MPKELHDQEDASHLTQLTRLFKCEKIVVQSRFDWKHLKKGSHQRLAAESREEYIYIFFLSVKYFPVIRVSCAACWSHRWCSKSRLTLKVLVELSVCKWYLNWSLAVKDRACLGAEAQIGELKVCFPLLPPLLFIFFALESDSLCDFWAFCVILLPWFRLCKVSW